MSYGCIEAVCKRVGLTEFERIAMTDDIEPGRLLLHARKEPPHS